MKFILNSDFKPAGDQPKAINDLCSGLNRNEENQILLGVTGSGKTFTMANIINNVQRPALIFAPNKILAAQLYSEMKSFFPKNHVEYFVSYYDYYTPEAYVARTDTYIEKESAINEQIDKMRHSATRALLENRDTIIVASVSCIYGLGSVKSYLSMKLEIIKNNVYSRDEIKMKLVSLQYLRNDDNFIRGTFRNRGDIIEIFPAHMDDRAWRISFFSDTVEEIHEFDPLTGKIYFNHEKINIFPNSHYVTPKPSLDKAIKAIKEELIDRIDYFTKEKKLIEAQRIEQRTNFDIEMIVATGSCSGIENYSRHLTGRLEGEPPPTLFEYLPKDSIVFIDESHVTIPQIGGMYKGDRSRKLNLSEYGFRLPSCKDNRPLKFDEWLKFKGQTIYVSATPGPWELEKTKGVFIEQIVRPTGLIEPNCKIRSSKNQIEDLVEECKKFINKDLRILVTTLTKKYAEKITDYFNENNISAKYMHSDIDAIERIELIRSLRLGEFDVLVGINLLREGLDIPECGLVAILDADKEGFLRSKVSLIQTIGRAARNINGEVILYADKKTQSINSALEETERRRSKQREYNKLNNIEPRSTSRKIIDILEEDRNFKKKKLLDEDRLVGDNLNKHIKNLKVSMMEYAENLDFEKAAQIRDEIKELEKNEIGVR
ncbi:excinuclease ABC subunit UvrB [Rickettsiales bacterium]|nr:excinuclease ABC subunit UvrB [Rickettsiales bacterium]